MINYEISFVNTNGLAFPNTASKNASAPGAGDGTEFVKLMIDDWWGHKQALMDYAGMTPDGVTEAPGTAQILQALAKGYGIGPGIGVEYVKTGTPAANGDRVILRQGQIILIATYPLLCAAVYCGDAANPTAPAYYKTSDVAGTLRDTAGAYMVLPDTRGLSPKNIGDATVNGRVKVGPTARGEKQEDQGQGHWHGMYYDWRAYIVDVSHPNSLSGMSTSADFRQLSSVYLRVIDPITDGVNGTPRMGENTRDSTFGTNFGLTY